MTLGQRIRRARLDAGLSVKALAKKAGLKAPTLYDLESGRQKTTTRIASIAAATGHNATWLETGRGLTQAAPEPAPRAPPGPLDHRVIQYLLDAIDEHEHRHGERLSNDARARLIADHYSGLLERMDAANREVVNTIVAEAADKTGELWGDSTRHDKS